MRSSKDILRRWDSGSRQQRISILLEFIASHKNSTGADIERNLGPTVMLFFTRITAWLRLTYMLGYELAVQLTAISLFLQGQRYLTNFMEIGGIQTLLDIVCHRTKITRDKETALSILIHIANSGRVFREMICEEVGYPEDRVKWAEGVLGVPRDHASLKNNTGDLKAVVQNKLSAAVADLRQHSASAEAKAAALKKDVSQAMTILAHSEPYTGVDLLVDALLHDDGASFELFGALFLALGHGNPRKGTMIDLGLLRVLRRGNESAALCAASTLRSLQSSKQCYANDGFALAPFHALTDGPSGNTTQSEIEDLEFTDLIDTLSKLLDKDSVKLRFEGTELLVSAGRNDRFSPQVLQKMIEFLEGDPAHRPSPDRFRASSARVLGKLLAAKLNGKEAVVDMAEVFTRKKVCVTMLQALKQCDAKDIDMQREAIAFLQVLARNGGHCFSEELVILTEVMGEKAVASLEQAETFTVDDLRGLKTIVQNSTIV
ncbi:hypothetical protein DIPPA_16165 [Diplonema papillatum]|nr:hypothetical protein DIPPA_16165 [Diplonema papillatum]